MTASTGAHRHEHRRRNCLDRLLDLCDGSVRGLRMSDLGCNAGFWSLLATEGGGDPVLGVDDQQVDLDRAGPPVEER